jgi:RNA-binding protein YlmH
MEYDAQWQTYKNSLESAREQLQRVEQQIISTTSMTLDELKETNSSWLERENVIALIEDKLYLEALVASREELFEIADGYLKDT